MQLIRNRIIAVVAIISVKGRWDDCGREGRNRKNMVFYICSRLSISTGHVTFDETPVAAIELAKLQKYTNFIHTGGISMKTITHARESNH